MRLKRQLILRTGSRLHYNLNFRVRWVNNPQPPKKITCHQEQTDRVVEPPIRRGAPRHSRPRPRGTRPPPGSVPVEVGGFYSPKNDGRCDTASRNNFVSTDRSGGSGWNSFCSRRDMLPPRWEGATGAAHAALDWKKKNPELFCWFVCFFSVLFFSAGWGSSQQPQQPTTVDLLQQVGNLHEGTTMRSVEVCVSALFC